MVDTFWYIVMVPMVYAAFAWFIIWTAIKISRVLTAPNSPQTLRIFPEGKDAEDTSTGGFFGAAWDALTMPSLRRNDPKLWFFLTVFHISIVVLILAHLDLLPQISIMSAESNDMIGYGAVGVLLIISLLYLMFRRILSPLREISVPGDYLLLFFLFCLVVSGAIISWGNSWSADGFVITKSDVGAYLDSLIKFTFADPSEYMSGAHYSIIGVHVLLANLFLIVLPFSKVMHSFFAIPLNMLRRG